MKKIALMLIALAALSAPASAGLPAQSTISYKVSLCTSLGGDWVAGPSRRVGTIWVNTGYCQF